MNSLQINTTSNLQTVIKGWEQCRDVSIHHTNTSWANFFILMGMSDVVERGRQRVWGCRARLASMILLQLIRFIFNFRFHLTLFNTDPTLVLFRGWYFKCRCQHHLAQTRQKSFPLRWWCDLREEVVGAFALRSSARCSPHHLLTSTTLSVLRAATPVTHLNTKLRTSFLYQHGSSRSRTL